MSHAFELINVKKTFGDVKALQGVSLRAEEGKIFGLLGPNGAGKTTMVRILSTLLEADSGDVRVLGIDAKKDPQLVRESIGLAGQYAAVDEFLTGYENIYMTGRLYRLNHTEAKKRTDDLLERLSLTEAANRQVKTYSGGMRRRLDLGASLVGEPKVLFLDEPTTGLDPKTRLELWDIVRELVDEGATILLTTQYMEEADELADQIMVVNEGRVIAEGTSDTLKARLGGDIVEFELEKGQSKDKALAAIKAFAKQTPSVDDENLRIRVPVVNGSRSLLEIAQSLNQNKIRVSELSMHRPSLDDVFLTLTGDKTAVEANNNRKKRVEL